MNIGAKITQLRKKLNLSQAALAKKVGGSRTIIGNYERDLNVPSLDMIVKLADVFKVSTDYLISDGKFAQYDKEVLKRIDDIEQLDSETKSKLFFLIDNITQNFKAKQAYS